MKPQKFSNRLPRRYPAVALHFRFGREPDAAEAAAATFRRNAPRRRGGGTTLDAASPIRAGDATCVLGAVDLRLNACKKMSPRWGRLIAAASCLLFVTFSPVVRSSGNAHWWIAGGDEDTTLECRSCRGPCVFCGEFQSQSYEPANALRCGWFDADDVVAWTDTIVNRTKNLARGNMGGSRGFEYRASCEAFLKSVLHYDVRGRHVLPGRSFPSSSENLRCYFGGTETLDGTTLCLPLGLGQDCKYHWQCASYSCRGLSTQRCQ